ncbi:ATP-dependent helicase [Lactobacillus nasalidis]|uniref:ATP-dependent helicase n=7 Tax=Lactobacillus nasalidis TaxID=2797258 RepID=A0ABQ3W4Y5_9LACO|nr:DEAD/DEAH box helicase [Lactobacillus nasalidis]GHW00754.1 ATP-dependent helicase [Lactobacillus nasalidis]
MDTFSRYAPFIQDYIYARGWETLRPLQTAAADVIFNSSDNLLLSASTASGKTEAAFFPILTDLAENPADSIACLYIAPLKALINDQYDRLRDICEESDIPVWRYHGDVAASQKRRMFKKPRGVLQITPESLESLLINKHADIPRLFGDLRYVVIDELHSFLRSDRGGQTFCLLERLNRLADVKPRRVGLSATIGDPAAAGRFLGAGSGHRTKIPRVKSQSQRWRLSMEHFYKQGEQAGEGSALPAQAVLAPASDQAPDLADPGLAYIFDHTRGKKCLVFTNSREECEAVCQVLRQYCENRHEPDRFMIHHGNLSAAFRQGAEAVMKDEDAKITTCATATLELGIDVGQLERAFQIEAPFTVSGFLQRMGRTGRRGNPAEMWFVMREEQPESRAMLPVLIPWSLLQGIALVELYLQERWVEPPKEHQLPYSLLYHQTMSTLMAGGEMTPAQLASRVLTLSYFRWVSQEDYKQLLRHLIKTDQIQTTENGGLIVGLAGERVTNNFKFYAVFQENEEYSVHAESEELGTIVKPPPLGEKIAIAGHVWVVEEIDRRRRQVYVHQVKGRIPAYFGDVAGDIHPRILQQMRQILEEDRIYPYLMKNAAARLNETRSLARAAGLPGRQLVNLGANTYCLFPWTGSYAFLALERFLRLKCAPRLGLKNFDSVRPYYMQFTMDVSEQDFYQILQEEAAKDFDPLDLLYPKEVPVFDKYDEYLPDDLVRKEFAYGVLDLAEMRRCVEEITRQKG